MVVIPEVVQNHLLRRHKVVYRAAVVRLYPFSREVSGFPGSGVQSFFDVAMQHGFCYKPGVGNFIIQN
jgi:hypothetical protein